MPDQPQALDDAVRPVARRAERARRERADGMLPDPDRDRQVRLHAEAAHVRLLRPRVLGELVGKADPDGLTPDELRVVPGQLGWHDWGGVGLHPGARPRGDGRQVPPIRRELEQRAPIGVEELDEPTQAVLDLLVDALQGQPREAGRELADEALGSAALVARLHDDPVYQEESVTFHDLPRDVSAFRARRSTGGDLCQPLRVRVRRLRHHRPDSRSLPPPAPSAAILLSSDRDAADGRPGRERGS